jgi:hypothetical protein
LGPSDTVIETVPDTVLPVVGDKMLTAAVETGVGVAVGVNVDVGVEVLVAVAVGIGVLVAVRRDDLLVIADKVPLESVVMVPAEAVSAVTIPPKIVTLHNANSPVAQSTSLFLIPRIIIALPRRAQSLRWKGSGQISTSRQRSYFSQPMDKLPRAPA